MLNSDMKSLGDDSVSDLFVYDDSQSSGVDIEDCAGSAVIVFVGHGFVDSTIDNDINDITDLVCSEVLGHSDSSVASESLLEFVSGSSFISVAVSHTCEQYLLFIFNQNNLFCHFTLIEKFQFDIYDSFHSFCSKYQ
jgi:hypothetical protein